MRGGGDVDVRLVNYTKNGNIISIKLDDASMGTLFKGILLHLEKNESEYQYNPIANIHKEDVIPKLQVIINKAHDVSAFLNMDEDAFYKQSNIVSEDSFGYQYGTTTLDNMYKFSCDKLHAFYTKFSAIIDSGIDLNIMHSLNSPILITNNIPSIKVSTSDTTKTIAEKLSKYASFGKLQLQKRTYNIEIFSKDRHEIMKSIMSYVLIFDVIAESLKQFLFNATHAGHVFVKFDEDKLNKVFDEAAIIFHNTSSKWFTSEIFDRAISTIKLKEKYAKYKFEISVHAEGVDILDVLDRMYVIDLEDLYNLGEIPDPPTDEFAKKNGMKKLYNRGKETDVDFFNFGDYVDDLLHISYVSYKKDFSPTEYVIANINSQIKERTAPTEGIMKRILEQKLMVEP